MRLLVPLAALVGVLGLPFLLAGVSGWDGQRSFTTELGSTLGISALGLLSVVVILPARTRALARLGADVAVRLHRHLVGVLMALIIGHVILAVAFQPARWALLGVMGQPWRVQAAVASVVCLCTLILVSVRRRKLRISYARWRALHGALAVGTLLFAVAHTYGWQRYLGQGGGNVALALLLALPLAALISLRFARRPSSAFILEGLVREAGSSTSLLLRAEDGRGRGFEPGQFAWLGLADGATRFAEHPFSYTSSAQDPSRVSFTIRAYGGFSAQVGNLPVGTRFRLDGPHGSFRLRRRASGAVLIAYGIGITASMSILRTAAERGDRRRFLLFYANRDGEDIVFDAELRRLRATLDLEVIHVLSKAPRTWAGERGRITAAVLQHHLPASLARWDFFLCGAGDAVDSGVVELTRIGVPAECVHAERFVEV